MFEGEGLHLIRLTARHPCAALSAVDHAVCASGAAVRHLMLKEVAKRSVVTVMLADISAPTARRITDAIARAVGVDTVCVEHVWGRG